MPSIWHICHTKHKNGVLWDVPNLKNYTTWLQYPCKFATVRTDVAKVLLFYIPFSLSSLFIFSFLFSLTLRFPLSSPCTDSLSLRLVRDVHRQRQRHSSDDDNALRHARSRSNHSISLQPLDLTHAPATRSCRSHPEVAVDLMLSHAPATLPFSGCGFFFFFFSLQFGLICWWWWAVDYGRW